MSVDLAAHLEVIRPDGPGPFPVVVQMHGCGGLQSMQRRYAQAAREAGIAAVILDSFGPRGIARSEALMTVCTGLRLRGPERAGDLTAVLEWLETQAWADSQRVAAAGWSHGGWSIMEALAAASPHAATARLKLAALIYPYAGPGSRTAKHGWGSHRPKVLACLAGRDFIVGVAGPRKAVERLQADGLDVDLLRLPDATHAFDDDEANDIRVRYRADYEAQLRDRYLAALRSAL